VRKAPGLLTLVAILVWFNCGDERLRISGLDAVARQAGTAPWLLVRAFVSRDGDERLYWEYSRLALGAEPDLDYLALKRLGDRARNRQQIASRIRPGPGWRLPYRDFPFEYPPLALALMILPRLVARDLPRYRLAYGVCAAVLVLASGVVAAALSRRLGARGPAQPWHGLALFTLAVGPILVGRFDALPALLVGLALVCVLDRRPFSAGLVLGAAVLAKLYPLLLTVPWLALLGHDRRWREALRLSAGVTLAVGALSAPFLWVAPQSFLASTLSYEQRPFQIESTVGSLVVLSEGRSVISAAAGSFNVLTPAALDALWSLALPLGIAGLAMLILRGPTEAAAAETARAERYVVWTSTAILWILLTSKVLSPQYLIWLMPLATLVPRRSSRAWALAAAVLTQIYYPYLYGLLTAEGSPSVAALVVIRNGALAWLAWTLVRSRGGLAVRGRAIA
jgi:hypothetical protein